MIRFDKFTLKSQEALQAAQAHAQEKGNPAACAGTSSLGADPAEGRCCPSGPAEAGRQYSGSRDRTWPPRWRSCPRSRARQISISVPALNRILEDAQKEADQFKDEYVSTEHLLIALANAKGEAVAKALQVPGRYKGRHPEGAGLASAAARKSPIPIPKKSIRPCSVIRAILPILRARESSIL